MAINKTTVVNGVTGTFWHTEHINLAPNMGATRAHLRLYASQSAYLSGSAAISDMEVDLQNGDNPCQMQSIAALVEAKLVTMAGTFLSGTVV